MSLLTLSNPFQQGFPVHQGHFEVDEQQVEGAAAEQVPGDLAILRGLDGGAPAVEEAAGDIKVHRVVFHEEDVDAGELLRPRTRSLGRWTTWDWKVRWRVK